MQVTYAPMQQAFSIGDIVCLKAYPGRQGPAIERLSPSKGRNRCRVFHVPDDTPDSRDGARFVIPEKAKYWQAPPDSKLDSK